MNTQITKYFNTLITVYDILYFVCQFNQFQNTMFTKNVYQ